MPTPLIPPEMEKLTINVSVVDLGQIDLLVEEGSYASRSDFVRTSLRNQLGQHVDQVRETSTRRRFAAGVQTLSKKDLERLRAKKVRIDVRVVGMLVILKDVTPQLAVDTLNSVVVRGTLRIPAEVRTAIADRIA
jgi:Arc/MetJ-type ribon-helix-helix transcriptional regulator